MKSVLKQSGYTRDVESDVWKNSGFTGIEYSDGEKVEIQIASIINAATDLTVLSSELVAHCVDWPTLYHLSSARANILRPFESKLKGNILEIGAGCGAITRFLGESGAKVLALEGSLRRASIARSRVKDLQNIEVVCERFESFQCNQLFDVITLIGVFEYANLYSSTDNSHFAMLKSIKSMLRPGGRLIIAIENQLGLKYFSGAAEDHVGLPMYGLENHYDNKGVRTFGKRELKALLSQSGFSTSNFYAPYPDYKLPISIVTEKGFNKTDFDASVFACQSVNKDPQIPSHVNFSMELVWPGLFLNGVALDLANSFLVEAVNEKTSSEKESPILAYHYSTGRIPPFCKETIFIQREKLGIAVKIQKLNISDFEFNSDLIRFEPQSQCDYIHGNLLAVEFIRLVSSNEWQLKHVADFIQKYIEIISSFLRDIDDAALVKDSKLNLFPGSFYDAIPQNIICSVSGEYSLIDTEWSLEDDIELERLVFRSLVSLIEATSTFNPNSDCEGLTRYEFIVKIFEIVGLGESIHKLDSFLEAEIQIVEEITGQAARAYLSSLMDRDLPSKNIRHAFQSLSEKNEKQQSELNHQNIEILATNKRNELLTEELQLMSGSLSWKITAVLRHLGIHARSCRDQIIFFGEFLKANGGMNVLCRKATKVLLSEGLVGLVSKLKTHGPTAQKDYSVLAAESRKQFKDRQHDLRREIDGFNKKPLISVVMPVFNADERFLRKAITSVQAQVYKNWELCVADDASTQPHVKQVLDEFVKSDSRIKVSYRTENGHISACTNTAIKMTTGSFVCFMDNDDEIPPHALFFFVRELNEYPLTDLMYSDEDHIGIDGTHKTPFFKPDWSPFLLYCQNYIGHFVCVKKSKLEQVGQLRIGAEGSQDHDLLLRLSGVCESIKHIPEVLYHWREHAESTAINPDSKPYAHKAGIEAVRNCLNEKYPDVQVEVQDGANLFTYCPQFPLAKSMLVSIIIPTRDKVEYLSACIESIQDKTVHSAYEIILVDNGSKAPETTEYFEKICKKDSRIKIVSADVPFNWSKLNNIGVQQASGEVFVFLNNDIEVITPDWLEKLGGISLLPDVGVVGPLLRYDDDLIQHAGVVVGMSGWADHVYKNMPTIHSITPFVSPVLSRNVLAITGACLVISRDKFSKLGDFDEEFIICGSDVELGIRAYQSGYHNVYCADAELYHFESKSRGTDVPTIDFERSSLKYGDFRLAGGDPFYNSNLDIMSTTPAARRLT